MKSCNKTGIKINEYLYDYRTVKIISDLKENPNHVSFQFRPHALINLCFSILVGLKKKSVVMRFIYCMPEYYYIPFRIHFYPAFVTRFSEKDACTDTVKTPTIVDRVVTVVVTISRGI